MPPPREDWRRALLDLLAEPSSPPMRKRTLAKRLEIPDDEYVDFRHLVDELVEQGDVAEVRHGKFGLPRPGQEPRGRRGPKHPAPAEAAGGTKLPHQALTGRIDIKRGGFGFLLSDPPGNDLFISGDDLGGALSGDLVAVLPRRAFHGARRGRPAGRVLRVLERAHPLLVGTFHAYKPARHTPSPTRGEGFTPPEGPGGFVTPDTRGVFEEIGILPADCGAAQEGDKVAIELIEPGPNFRSGARPTGKVVKVYGEAGQARAEIEAIVQNFNLRTEYPAAVLEEAAALPEEVPADELAQRTDYTTPVTFTIDPPDAKDHDDAVALRTLPGGRTELLVHIADVSYYVREDSPIDREARERGTSVYLPGLTLPMLPPRLSSDLCSLREGQLRLTKTAAITFSRSLHVESARIERSYIRSAAFLTYDQVKEALDADDPKKLPGPEIFDALRHMQSFAKALRRKRLEDGSIDLDLPEVKLLLDANGAVTGFAKEEHHWAHQLIEDMMLAANRAVADYLVEHELPGLFRIHEEPDPEDLAQFAEFIRGFGLSMRPPYDRRKFQSVLTRVRGKEYEHAIQLALLTSLKQAHYSAECQPHYALAFTRYLHFTSPIRRYPDLIVHRALDTRFEPGEKALPAHGKKRRGGEGGRDYFRRLAFLRPLAVHCSQRERQADQAEEEVNKVRQIQYLRAHLRDNHPGIIVRVVEAGLVIEMQDCYVEGFVRVQDLGDDYYEYFPDQHLLQGRRQRRSFRLGDKVTVQVVHIDVGARKVGLTITNA